MSHSTSPQSHYLCCPHHNLEQMLSTEQTETNQHGREGSFTKCQESPDTVRDAPGTQRLSKKQPLFAQSLNPKASLHERLDRVQAPKPPGPQLPQLAPTSAFASLQACCNALGGNLYENALPNTHVNQKQHCNLAIAMKSTGFALFSGLFSHFPTI